MKNIWVCEYIGKIFDYILTFVDVAAILGRFARLIFLPSTSLLFFPCAKLPALLCFVLSSAKYTGCFFYCSAPQVPDP